MVIFNTFLHNTGENQMPDSNSVNPSDHRRSVRQWLSQKYEWRIPVYQRHYAWNPHTDFGPTQLFWETVEEQAKHRLRNLKIDPHYFGAIIIENKTEDLASVHKYDVVDGQQRLTTLSLALFAIIGIVSQFSSREKIQDNLAPLIFNDSARGERKFPKLIPTNFDRTQFRNILSFSYDASAPKNQDHSKQAKESKVWQAFKFLGDQFEQFIAGNAISDDKMRAVNALVETILDGFELVLIPLKKTDKAQKVFESLNNTATPLTTFDLIRNNIFYRAVQPPLGYPSNDEKLFESDVWRQFEDPFWEKPAGQRADSNTHIEMYVALMLMAKTCKFQLLNRNSIFKEYKKFAYGLEELGENVDSELETISVYVDVYKYLVGKTDEKPQGAEIDFGYFRHVKSNNRNAHPVKMDFYPVIFAIATCDAPVDEKQRMVLLLESHIIRRHVCHLTEAAYNRQAPEICKALGDSPTYDKLAKFLKYSQDSETREFPEMEKVSSACVRENFYKRPLKAYIFNRIAWYTTTERNETRSIQGLTIDHIMPQAWRDREGWNRVVQVDSPEDVDTKIQTIGNLTPISKGSNTAKSNKDWEQARKIVKQCDLKLTRELADKEQWNLREIDARSRELAKIICKIWRADIPEDTQ